MRRLRHFGIATFLLFTFTLAANPAAFGQRGHRKYKAPPKTTKIDVTVVRASNGKPIHNAAVVFHPTKDEKNEGNMEVKTNEEGKTSLDMIPTGSSVLLQVIASGYRTYGQEYKIEGTNQAIVVKMELPTSQFTTYKSGSSADNSHTNVPQPQMGQASPADSTLLNAPSAEK